MSTKIYKKIDIIGRGRVVRYSGTNVSYAQLLQEYIGQGGDLRGIDHSNRDLTGFRFPEGADHTASEFSNCKLTDASSPRGIFVRCRFYRTEAHGFIAKGGIFDDAEIFDSNFSRAMFKSKASFKRVKVMNSSFKVAYLAETDWADSSIETSTFYRADCKFMSFPGMSAIDCDFTEVKFVPEEWCGKTGSRAVKVAAKSGEKKRIDFLQWFNNLYTGSKLIGCKYERAQIPPDNIDTFPSEHKVQASMSGFLQLAGVGGFIALNQVVMDPLFDDLKDAVMHSHIVTAAASQSLVYAAGLGAVIGVAWLADGLEDKVSETVRKGTLKVSRLTQLFKNHCGNKIHDVANLVLLAGKVKALAPIRAALIATAVSWERSDDGNRLKYTRPFASWAVDKTRIIICDQRHLKLAMDVLETMNNSISDKHIHHPMVFLRHHEDPTRPAAVMVTPKHEMRAVWKVDHPRFKGHISMLWSGKGKHMQTDAIPHLSPDELNELLEDRKFMMDTAGISRSDVLKSLIDLVVDEAKGLKAAAAEALRITKPWQNLYDHEGRVSVTSGLLPVEDLPMLEIAM